MTLCLALGLYLGGNMGAPADAAPVFANEPGTLADIVNTNVVNLGFTRASGYPPPSNVLDVEPALPDNVLIFVNDGEALLPAGVPGAYVHTLSLQGLTPMTETFDLKLTSTNSEGSAVSTATVSINIPVPAPEWSTDAYAVEAPISNPYTFGNNLSVTNCDTIRVAGLPNKCIFYKLGVGTPYVLNDEFPVADLTLLTIESDGDTGAVTGVLKLRALGSSNVDLDITVTIAPPLPPEITERDFDIEEGTEASASFDTSTMGDSELASIDNQTTGGSAIIVKIPDLS